VSSADERTRRGERRRRLGQNFLRPDIAERIVAEARFRAGELVLEIGAGSGALTLALARRGVRVVADEVDREHAARLRARLARNGATSVRVVTCDFLGVPLPSEPFRAIGSLPFVRTTDVLQRLFGDPRQRLARADLVVQWEVARKRAAVPPATLLSAQWAPWWEFRLAGRIPATAFDPVPRVDAGVLVATRRAQPLLPPAMAGAYAAFVRARWPFPGGPDAYSA
jgi:23S rRNA (adenine-N6)-dimethyltransferase